MKFPHSSSGLSIKGAKGQSRPDVSNAVYYLVLSYIPNSSLMFEIDRQPCSSLTIISPSLAYCRCTCLQILSKFFPLFHSFTLSVAANK